MRKIKVNRKAMKFRWTPPSLLEEALAEGMTKEQAFEVLPSVTGVVLSIRAKSKIEDQMFQVVMKSGESKTIDTDQVINMSSAIVRLNYCLASVKSWSKFEDTDGSEFKYDSSRDAVDALFSAIRNNNALDYADYASVASGDHDTPIEELAHVRLFEDASFKFVD